MQLPLEEFYSRDEASLHIWHYVPGTPATSSVAAPASIADCAALAKTASLDASIIGSEAIVAATFTTAPSSIALDLGDWIARPYLLFVEFDPYSRRPRTAKSQSRYGHPFSASTGRLLATGNRGNAGRTA
jgi:hypothetical protein